MAVVAIVVIGALISLYNRLVRLKTMVQEAWSGIDVQLKKRYDLIPNLVESVKGYAKHERKVLDDVTRSRSVGINASTVAEQGQAENVITQALGKLFAVAENYPDLKANTNFIDLQKQLSQVENDIQLARRYYNGSVRNNNIAVQSFPSNLVAGMFGFSESEFFELEDTEQRTAPKVDFSQDSNS